MGVMVGPWRPWLEYGAEALVAKLFAVVVGTISTAGMGCIRVEETATEDRRTACDLGLSSELVDSDVLDRSDVLPLLFVATASCTCEVNKFVTVE